jgi:hypothetical protein
MRKFILAAALVLASATAQADNARDLITKVSIEEPAAESAVPKYVPRPPIADAAAAKPSNGQAAKLLAEKAAEARKLAKLRRQGASTEARVIHELNRRGIRW